MGELIATSVGTDPVIRRSQRPDTSRTRRLLPEVVSTTHRKVRRDCVVTHRRLPAIAEIFSPGTRLANRPAHRRLARPTQMSVRRLSLRLSTGQSKPFLTANSPVPPKPPYSGYALRCAKKRVAHGRKMRNHFAAGERAVRHLKRIRRVAPFWRLVTLNPERESGALAVTYSSPTSSHSAPGHAQRSH